MDLDDFIHLSRVVVNEVKQSISSRHEKIAWLLRLCKLHHSFIEDLASRSVVKDHRLSWQMPTFYLVKLDVLFPTANYRILHHTVELYEISLEV